MILWDNVSISFFIILSPSGFRSHWWFLPEIIITIVAAKSWFSSSTSLSVFINWNSTVNKNILFSPWFIYLFIYLYEYRLKDFYFILWAILHYYERPYDTQIVPDSVSGNPFKLASVFFIQSPCFFEHFLSFPVQEMLQVHLVLFLPCTWTATSPRSPVKEWYLEAKTRVLQVLIAREVFLETFS